MKCPKCKKGEMYAFVNFLVEMPFEDIYNAPKRNFRKKEYQIWSADWDKIRSIHCDKCGYIQNFNR